MKTGEDNGERFRGCLTGFNCEVKGGIYLRRMDERGLLEGERGREATLERNSPSSEAALAALLQQCGLWISFFVTSLTHLNGSPRLLGASKG